MSTPRDYVDDTKRRDRIVSQRDSMEFSSSILDKYAYQYFGSFFSEREDFLSDYQETLKAAHIAEGSDLYLGKMILIALLSGILTFALSFVMMIGLFSAGLLSIVGSATFVQLIFVGFVPLFLSSLIGLISGSIYYVRPSYLASRRASSIDITLPSAVTFMYALNRGGMNIVEVLRTLAQNEEVYGEVSVEVGTIIQDMDYFSRDLMEALRRAGERSPSQKFSDLMDDMVATIDSGASTAPFLEGKSEDLIDEAERDQANFIETLSLLGEVYVTAFVAGPLFMIIITVIMAMLGGANPTQLDGIVYGLLPFMNLGYFFLINILSGEDAETDRKIPYSSGLTGKADVEVDEYAEKTSDQRIKNVVDAKKKRERTAIIRQPVTELIRDPDKTLIFTAPLCLIYLVLIPLIGPAETSLDAFISQPVAQTVYWLLTPIFILSIPLSIFYEIQNRRRKKLMNRLPEALKTLASANKVGMTLTESLENTANNTTGRLGDELKSVKNDIKWNHDVNKSLVKLANRIQIPLLTRTVKLITEANASTGNIENVIQIAAKNVETQVRLKKERASAMIMYTTVILISFCVYMFVVALLDMMFLSVIGEMDPADFGSSNSGGSDFEISDLPIERFRLVFYHSTIVQAFGSGMIAGYLSSNNVRSGLKFAVVLCIVSSLVFGFL
jgi:flagellar protein FlaJ